MSVCLFNLMMWFLESSVTLGIIRVDISFLYVGRRQCESKISLDKINVKSTLSLNIVMNFLNTHFSYV